MHARALELSRELTERHPERREAPRSQRAPPGCPQALAPGSPIGSGMGETPRPLTLDNLNARSLRVSVRLALEATRRRAKHSRRERCRNCMKNCTRLSC